MYRAKLPFLLLLSLVLPASGAVVSEVRFKLSAGDLFSAEAIAEDYHAANGTNSEYAAAVAWLARGALIMSKTDLAARHLAETKALVSELLKTKRVEDDAYLESAIGIEQCRVATVQLQSSLENEKHGHPGAVFAGVEDLRRLIVICLEAFDRRFAEEGGFPARNLVTKNCAGIIE